MILHLTRDFPPRSRGGISTAVGATTLGLSQHGVPWRVIYFDAWGSKVADHRTRQPSDEHRPDGELSFRLSHKNGIPAATRWAAEVSPSIVHVHDPLLWELGKTIAAQSGARSVHTLHVLAHHQDRLRGLSNPTLTAVGQARAIEEADALIAPSPSVATQLSKDFPSAQSKVHVARLAVVQRRGGPPADRNDAEISVHFVGRFSDMTGIDQLPELIEALHGRFRIRLVGGLPDNPRAEKKWIGSLRQAADKFDTDLRFDGWLESPFAGVDPERAILIAPNRFATFGFTVGEAMAARLPVVAYGVGGLVDLIEHNRTGILVPRKAGPAGLAAAISQLASSPKNRSRLGTAARKHILANYQLAKASQELLAVYKLLGLKP